MRDKKAYYYPNSSWCLPFLGGYKFEVAPGVSNLDGAINFFYSLHTQEAGATDSVFAAALPLGGRTITGKINDTTITPAIM